MKKINVEKMLIVAGVAVLCMICVLTVVLVVRFRSSQDAEPGLLDDYTIIELQKKCYFISGGEHDPTIDGEGTFTISAVVRADPAEGGTIGGKGDFIGHMEVSEYPLQFEEVAQWYTVWDWGDILQLRSSSLKLVKPDLEAYYDVSIAKSNPDIIRIDIDLKDGRYVIAICGETEEEAKENYRLYWELWDKNMAEFSKNDGK